MSSLEETVGFAINPEPRCPVILLLDVSASMAGSPIKELNEGIRLFKQNIQSDEIADLRVEVSVVTFGSRPEVIHDFSTMDSFVPPTLEAKGSTPMGQAIELALDKLDERKNTYQDNHIPYFQPWLLMISDGAPTDHYTDAARKIRGLAAQNKLLFFCVAVKDADIRVLRKIAPEDRPPLPLDGLKFKELFQWLSQSVTLTSRLRIGAQAELDEVTSWTTITA